MAGRLVKSISSSAPFGAIGTEFEFDLRTGYLALVGPNNSGKSTILQWIARDLLQDANFGVEHVCYIEAERGYVSPTTEVQNQTFANYNSTLLQNLASNSPLNFSVYRSPYPGDLTKYLLNHKNFRRQLDSMDRLLTQLGLPPMDLQESQAVHFENVLAAYQGSGLRSLLPVLAALSDPAIQVVLIDEP